MATDQITFPHWIDISRRQLLTNLDFIKNQLSPATKIMAMVKANAYGHGLTLVAPTIAPHVDYLGVHTLQEAQSLHQLRLKPKIFIACPIAVSLLHKEINHNYEISTPSLDYLKSISHLPISIHLKVNTGMNRLGLEISDLDEALNQLQHSPLHLAGIYTHFHSSDTNRSSTTAQIKLFNQAVKIVKQRYPAILAHAANSSAIFNYPKSHFDLVRPGLALYGYGHPGLSPTLTWKSSLVQTRLLTAKSSVGYSATYHAQNPHYMGVLPFGYSDGFDRKLSNSGRVWADSNYFPIIGRVSMNFTTISLEQSRFPLPAIFELLGPHVTADELAAKTNSINYEIIARLNPLIPRQLV